MSVKIVGDADAVENLRLLPLGSGGEVGRSCVVMTFRGKNIMFDCGIHPAKNGLDSLPLFDDIDCETIDIVLITHFHLDHCGALPYLCEQTRFRGKVFMTHPTKAFYKMVMSDFIKVSSSSHDVVTDEWLHSTVARIEMIDYHQEVTHNGIRFHAYNAGHVLGAAMFMVEVAGVKVLYTGDYSRAPDRHLMGAETPLVSPDVLVVESTYGIQVHETREEREEKFTSWVHEIVGRGGRCLVPVFALGRAQELLLILEEYWAQHKELHSVKIHYASSLADKCMKLYKSYINMMNDRVRRLHDKAVNPFELKFIHPLRDLSSFDDSGPCVVLASPGMLQSGISLDLFERWCGDARNGLIVAGYCVDGTIAKEVLKKPREVTKENGQVLPVRMSSIYSVSFSAHSDAKQTCEFIAGLDTKHVMLVHGNEDAIGKLSKKLTEDFADRGMEVYPSRNQTTVEIPFKPNKIGRVMGRIAEKDPVEGDIVSGVMVISDDYRHMIVDESEVTAFTDLSIVKLQHATVLPLPRYFSPTEVLTHLRRYFAATELLQDIGVKESAQSKNIIEVQRDVKLEVREDADGHSSITVTWRSNKYADVIADVACVAITQLVSQSTGQLPMEVDNDMNFRLRCMQQMLAQHFPSVSLDMGTGNFVVKDEKAEATILHQCQVDTTDEELRKRVEGTVRRIYLTLFPVPPDFGWCDCTHDGPNDHEH